MRIITQRTTRKKSTQITTQRTTRKSPSKELHARAKGKKTRKSPPHNHLQLKSLSQRVATSSQRGIGERRTFGVFSDLGVNITRSDVEEEEEEGEEEVGDLALGIEFPVGLNVEDDEAEEEEEEEAEEDELRDCWPCVEMRERKYCVCKHGGWIPSFNLQMCKNY